MIPDLRPLIIALTMVCMAAPLHGAELRLSQGTNISADVATKDGRILVDLLGAVWLVPARGGDARRLVDSQWQARRPRWSPDGSEVLFASKKAAGSTLWRVAIADGVPERITPPSQSEQDGAWHPSGEQIVFAAARHDSGLDIWQRDLATGLDSRLTDHAGDETSPAWSADGRHLVYLRQENGRWYLMLKQFGRPPQILHSSERPIYAPAWRPDNTLVTFLERNGHGQLDLKMLIPSNPPLVRVFASGEDFFIAPVAWRDRSYFVYAADGVIKRRRFEDRQSRTLPFSAAVGKSGVRTEWLRLNRPLPNSKEPGGNLIVRAQRLFDGESDQYRQRVDIVIENGRILGIEDQRDRDGALIIDIPDSTVLPGFIDSYAAMPGNAGPALGARLLAFGVTTLVTPDLVPDRARTAWQSGPGPRLLTVAGADEPAGGEDDYFVRLLQILSPATAPETTANAIAAWRKRGVPLLAANWNSGLTYGADVLLGTANLPTSPTGRRYADVRELAGGRQMLLISGAADQATPGLRLLQDSPQGKSAGIDSGSGRRFADGSDWLETGARVIVGSRPSGLPPGFATQAELIALHTAGLSPSATLGAATSAAADALGAGDEIGRVAPGARADLVLVAGDPLQRLADAGQVVAVVRDGYFYSVARLLELASSSAVE